MDVDFCQARRLFQRRHFETMSRVLGVVNPGWRHVTKIRRLLRLA